MHSRSSFLHVRNACKVGSSKKLDPISELLFFWVFSFFAPVLRLKIFRIFPLYIMGQRREVEEGREMEMPCWKRSMTTEERIRRNLITGECDEGGVTSF